MIDLNTPEELQQAKTKLILENIETVEIQQFFQLLDFDIVDYLLGQYHLSIARYWTNNDPTVGICPIPWFFIFRFDSDQYNRPSRSIVCLGKNRYYYQEYHEIFTTLDLKAHSRPMSEYKCVELIAEIIREELKC